MKLKYIVSVIILVLFAVVIYVMFDKDGVDKISEGFKCDYILINSAGRENVIEYYVYESFYSDESNTKSKIKEAYILDAVNNKINISIDSITKEKQAIYTKKGDMYKKTITLKIEGKDEGLYSDTKLYIKMDNDKESLEYKFGDIYYFSPNEDNYISEEVDVLQITSVLSSKNDIPYTVGLIIELDVKKEICITDFKLGLSDYCTYKSNITKLDMTFDEVVSLDDWNRLDQHIKDVYVYSDKSVAENSVSSCVLEKGMHVIVIPFSHSEDSNFIYSCGGILEYTVNNNTNRLVIEPSRRVAISSFSKEAIEKEVFDE